MNYKSLGFILLALLSPLYSEGQEYALTFQYNGNQANMRMPLNLTANFKTVSFWIKPNEVWDTLMTTDVPLLVKDKFFPNSTWGGRFQIFVSEGRVKWTMADYANVGGSTIQSDKKEWDPDVWVHLAFTITPNVGMKMFVNGIQQSETDSRDQLPPPPVEGADEAFYFGCWGVTGRGQPKATIDEIRFWNAPRTQNEIREMMCQRATCSGTLRAAYNFNNSAPGGADDVCNIYPAFGNASVTSDHIVVSTAPIGSVSYAKYESDWSGVVWDTRPGRDSVELSNIQMNGLEGVHVYFTPGRPEVRTGIPDTVPYVDGVIGVWCTDTTGRYDLQVTLNRRLNNPLIDCDDCTYLLSRDVHQQPWNLSTETSQYCRFNLANESGFQKGWRQEYYLIDELVINPRLGDTTALCSNESGTVRAFQMNGAAYRWSDGRTGAARSVTSSGILWVEMEWNGCIKYDTTYVRIDPVPEFEWVTDTTICFGDTIELTCPIADGVTYAWDTGDSTRTIKVWRRGVYVLTVNNGRCSFYNFVTVRIIPRINVELGPRDTLMCLGQEIEWDFIEGVGDYLWYNGQTDGYERVFNQPGTYWVSLQNECFWVSDTITIEFEDCDCRVDIPNAFTPDDNYINDRTGVFTQCYFQYYEFAIYDRWGNRVFYSDDPHARWDGTYKGMASPEGVYIYELAYRRWTGPEEPVIKRGRMTLIR